MSMTEAPYSLTLKTPRGNLFTVRGVSAGELKANLHAAADSELGLLALIGQIENTLSGQKAAAPAAATVSQVSTGAATGGASNSGQELPSGFGTPPCTECGSETRFDKEGVSSKSGKPYKRYMCTKSQLHKATFA